MARALGVDIGTTNVKVALVGDDGTELASAARPLTFTLAGDTAVQDTEAVWNTLGDAIRAVTAGQEGVDTIGICSQYSSIVPIDTDARPVAPMLMWQDLRGTDHSFEILGRHEGAFMTFVERHGIPPIGSGLSLGHILHYQLDRPDVHARTAAYVEAMDAVTARLTGRITANQHTSFMVQCCDNRTLGATQYDDDLVKLSGVDATRLPELIRVDDAIGTVQPRLADDLGLAPDAVVYAGTNDTATVAVGTGAFAPGRAGLAIGTTSVLVDAVDDFRVDLEHQILSMPGPYADRYVVCAENGLGGKVLEHVLHNVVFAADELADHRTDQPFAPLDDALRATEAGAGGVLFLPWLRGASAPQSSAAMRGGFVHMSLDTTRRDLVRAVCEGVAHNLRALLPHVEAFTGNSIEEIAFVGGAARSAQWCQVLANVLDRPVMALDRPDGAVARATALLALQRAGAITRADLDREPGGGTRFEPEPATRTLYADRHVQFEAAYAALLPISEALGT
jgi:xylulokinase